MIEILFEAPLPAFLLPPACLLILFLLNPITRVLVHVRDASIFREVLIILGPGGLRVQGLIGQSNTIIENVQVRVFLKEDLQFHVGLMDLVLRRFRVHTQRLI